MSYPTPSVQPIHPGERIGHVHLKVADLERARRDELAWARTWALAVEPGHGVPGRR